MLSSIVIIFVFYALCIAALIKDDHVKTTLNALSIRHIAVIAAFLMAMSVFVWYMINQNRYIYYWDYSGY